MLAAMAVFAGRRASRLLAALALASACVHPRDFQAPGERLTRSTAYAEQARVRVDTDLLAPDAQRFVANLGVTVAAVPRHLDFSVNLLHAAIGAVAVQSKFTVLDTRGYGLGGRVGLTYTTPATFYFLPRSLRQTLGSFHLLSTPIELWQSFPVARWFAGHLGLGYRFGSVWGRIDGDELFLDASLSQRSLTAIPVLDFFVARRVALRAYARLPLFTQVAEVTDATYALDPDVVVGVRSVEWVRRPFVRTVQLGFAAETRFGANTHLRLGVHLWAFRPIRALDVVPSLTLYWRFH